MGVDLVDHVRQRHPEFPFDEGFGGGGPGRLRLDGLASGDQLPDPADPVAGDVDRVPRPRQLQVQVGVDEPGQQNRPPQRASFEGGAVGGDPCSCCGVSPTAGKFTVNRSGSSSPSVSQRGAEVVMTIPPAGCVSMTTSTSGCRESPRADTSAV